MRGIADGGSESLLEPGMTLTDEPGVYLPGQFGVRIEDVLLVTASGANTSANGKRRLVAQASASDRELSMHAVTF